MSRDKVQPVRNPARIWSYVSLEWKSLIIITVTGILYNAGMTAGPYFEGQLAQKLLEIIQGTALPAAMMRLALTYLLVILAVQVSRALKRFYVRRFANNISRNLRHMLYNSLVHMDEAQLEAQGLGQMMTRAISDVDACAEGIRKFTTEVFDTGVVMIAYLALLMAYDWKLALISCAFTPAAYLIANALKKPVTAAAAAYKESAASLSGATMDRVTNAVTYRIGGCEQCRDGAYESQLSDYEQKAVRANIWENTMQPLYQVIAMIGVLPILILGARNVLGTGWTQWDIAAFTAFLSCFTKLAVKSSHAAKLFNSVQKAQVSWARIQPMLKEYQGDDSSLSFDPEAPADLVLDHVSIRWKQEAPVLHDITMHAEPGQIIGITGPVACGKSTLGKVFLLEPQYEGSIRIGGHELKDLTAPERSRILSYLGHEPQLMSDTIEENVCLGRRVDPQPCLDAVSLHDEIAALPQGIHTEAGSTGGQLSGGQQARVALARTLAHAGRILILDDPFSAVDPATETAMLEQLKPWFKDRVVLLISHRLRHFPEFDHVLYLENGTGIFSDHESLLKSCPGYAERYLQQTQGGDLDEQR